MFIQLLTVQYKYYFMYIIIAQVEQLNKTLIASQFTCIKAFSGEYQQS